jgi:hypothetical protein
MTGGTKAGDDPWASLAASIIERARQDCKGNIESGFSDIFKALIQWDAEEWLRHDPWCQFLLDCCLPLEYDVDKERLFQTVAMQGNPKRRQKSYVKHLPQGVDMKEQYPVASLTELTGLQYLHAAVSKGKVQGRLNGDNKWYCSMADIALAVVLGTMPH